MEKKKHGKRFAQVMAALAEVFDSGKEPSPLRVELYFTTLASFSIEEVEAAAMVMIQSRTAATFPRPGEILDFIKGGPEDRRATQAWEKVDRAMRGEGNYVSVDFGDPKIHRAIEMLGGWTYLGTLDESEWKWKRKEFESAYRAIQGNGGPDRVPGLIEQENAPRGYEVPGPVRMQQPARRLLQ